MKGDIAFAGFVLTAEEWQQLDPQSRAQLIAVATRSADPWLPRAPIDPGWDEPPQVDGSGPHDREELIELEPDPD